MFQVVRVEPQIDVGHLPSCDVNGSFMRRRHSRCCCRCCRRCRVSNFSILASISFVTHYTHKSFIVINSHTCANGSTTRVGLIFLPFHYLFTYLRYDTVAVNSGAASMENYTSGTSRVNGGYLCHVN